MKILIIAPGVLPIPATKGGAVEALIESYINYNEKVHEHDFTLYTMYDEHDYNNEYKYTKYIYINTNKYTYKIKQVLRYLINNKLPKIHIGNAFITETIKKLKNQKENFDMIIVENCPFYVLKLKKVYPDTPIILHLHNDYLNCKTKYAKKILNQYDKIISISEYIKKRIETIEKTNKISIVYNGVNISAFGNDINEEKIKFYENKYGIRKEDIVFLYTGRLVKEKGVYELVNAFKKIIITTGKSNIKLLVVGSKAGKKSKKDAYINKIIKSADKYRNNIIFTGFIDYNDLPVIHAISDVQIVPSRWGEPLGNVVIEGLASGIKQIVTADGGITELVKNTDAKVIATDNLTENLYEAMLNIINDNYYEKMPKKEKLNKFSEIEYSKGIFNVLQEVKAGEK